MKRNLFSRRVRHRDGFGLIETMVTSAIVVIVAMATLALTANSYKHQSRLSDKNDILSVNFQLHAALMMNDFCRCNFSGAVTGKKISFNGASPPSHLNIGFPLEMTRTDCTTAGTIVETDHKIAINSSVKVTSTKFVGLKSLGGANYLANLEVKFADEVSSTPPIAPLTIKGIILNTVADPAGGPTAVKVNACNQPSPTAGPGFLLVEHRTPTTSTGQGIPTSWGVKFLNTLPFNGITGASLAANQITLPAGDYWIDGYTEMKGEDNCDAQTRLYNVTDSSVVCWGQGKNWPNHEKHPLSNPLRCFFTLASASVLQVEIRADKGGCSAGPGLDNALGAPYDLHASYKIEKL